MAARAYWKGQIRIALVSIPVEIYSATKTGAQISFRQIHEPSGKRIRYEKVVPGVGPVENDEIIKGYEYEKNSFVLLDDEEIEAVKLESKKTLVLTQFVGAHEIDVLYYEKPYYVVPAESLAEEAFIVLRDALRKTGKVGLGQLAVRGLERVVSLKPCGNGMVLETLRYADEVKRAQTFFDDIGRAQPDSELLSMAEKLIEDKAAPFDPRKYHDRYVDALKDLIDKKRKAGGKEILEDAEEGSDASGGNVVDLMAALKQSLGDDTKKKTTPRKATPSQTAPSQTPPRKSRSRSKAGGKAA